MNILFTCAGRRTYLLKYFKEQLKENGLIIATDMQKSAPAFSAADITEIVPAVYDPKYIETTINICKKHKVDLLISLNDLELPILATNKVLFNEIGVKVIVSDKKVIDICFDKFKTAEYLKEFGINTPKTYLKIDDALNALNNHELEFPLVLKPRWGSGSIGIEFVDSIDELKLVYQLLRHKIKKSILSNASIEDDYILIQEKLDGQEYGIDVMNDLNGNNIAVSVKKKLAMRAGETDKAITVDNKFIREIGKQIGTNLKHIANLDCDVFEYNNQYYVLEMNPRFGGGYPFSHEAGVNLPKAIIEWAKGNNVENSVLTPEYNKMFAKCDYLVNITSEN